MLRGERENLSDFVMEKKMRARNEEKEEININSYSARKEKVVFFLLFFLISNFKPDISYITFSPHH